MRATAADGLSPVTGAESDHDETIACRARGQDPVGGFKPAFAVFDRRQSCLDIGPAGCCGVDAEHFTEFRIRKDAEEIDQVPFWNLAGPGLYSVKDVREILQLVHARSPVICRAGTTRLASPLKDAANVAPTSVRVSF